MGDDTTLGTVVLGLEGFALREATLVDGEVCLAVETVGRRPGCPDCGVVAAAHDRRTVQVRDLAIGGRPCRLVWSKRIWRCREPLCPTATWTERRDDVARPRHGSAMHAVTDDGLPLVDDPARTAGVSSLGVDERSFLKASYLRKRRTTFVTGLVDLNRSRLLDIVPGRPDRRSPTGSRAGTIRGCRRWRRSPWTRIAATSMPWLVVWTPPPSSSTHSMW